MISARTCLVVLAPLAFVLTGCTNDEGEMGPRGLQLSLAIEDDKIIVTAHNGFDHAIAFPATLQAA